MKKIIAIALIILSLTIIVGCKRNNEEEPADVKLEGISVSYEGLEDSKDFEKVDFYLQRNDEFNIHIYLVNDLNLEISKLKINNVEYLSEDFVEGSNNKLITLSFNTQNNTGVNNFKLNSVTYLKGGVEKLADIDVNDLVRINVQSRFVPVATVRLGLNHVFGYDLEVSISDREGLINISAGDAVFKLFEGELEVHSETLSYENELELTNLKADTLYDYKIEATYNENDGEGIQTRTIFEGNLRTKAPYEVVVHAPLETEISFDYSPFENGVTLSKIDLELNGVVEKNVPLGTNVITGLTEGKTYELVFHYEYLLEGVTIKNTQRVEAETFKLELTELIRNGARVPFAPGGSGSFVQIPNYRRQDEELRAIWFSTVSNIDIARMQPGELGLELYKDAIRLAFDNIKAANMNAVFFQIRPMNDAWYESDLAPWSRYITGNEGQDPGLDVLGFALEEAHARDIELHGWLNPYRVANSASALQAMHPTNFAYGREDLWLQGTTSAGALQTILDPGNPEVQVYIRNVIKEIIQNYPTINGIHFDDYFYLDSSMIGSNSNSPDWNTYQTYGKSYSSITEFRRESVTTIIRDIFNDVEAFNTANGTHIKFGISPSGIWDNKSSNPEGSETSGWSHLRALNADTKAWIEEEIIHYIIPQIYWDFTLSAARYANLVHWWSETVRGHNVDLIIGMGPYRLRDTAWLEVELADQLRFNQLYPEVVGSSFFTYQDLAAVQPARLVNAMNIIKNELWTTEARVPWETNIYDNEDN